jgi:hypothetical protein
VTLAQQINQPAAPRQIPDLPKNAKTPKNSTSINSASAGTITCMSSSRHGHNELCDIVSST